MAVAPAFAATPKLYIAQCTLADAARNDPVTSIITAFTAGGAGEKVSEISVEATVTTTAGMIRIFISKNAGTNKRLFDEFPISAVTVSATVAAFRASKTYDNLILENGDIMYATSEKAEAINVWFTTAQF